MRAEGDQTCLELFQLKPNVFEEPKNKQKFGKWHVNDLELTYVQLRRWQKQSNGEKDLFLSTLTSSIRYPFRLLGAPAHLSSVCEQTCSESFQ